MTLLYILAHFDDEYCALPMIWRAVQDGRAQRFLYLADYRDRALGERRLAETRAFLATQGVAPAAVEPIGLGTGVFDGEVHRSVAALFETVAAAARREPVEAIVTPGWEGGHMDHDACAYLATRLAPRIGDPPIRQFSLYNGPGLPGPLLHGSAPLPQNGPVEPVRLSAAEWLRWMAAVRHFPSQLYAWSGIWPAMFWTMARRGFGWQRLDAARVGERPHPGPLFYERMFGVAYEEVAAALAAALP
ncbi:MAG: hypothetical protein E7812_13585 [Phenylobacterium sp.]|nr:MAG: hypothetical protein E7812_13585 [Phenylobacterium sp.]